MFDFPDAPTLNQLLTGPNGVLYKWDGVKWAIMLAAGPYLPLVGGTLSGPLYLSSDPTLDTQAATKLYVDTHVPVGGGILDAPIDGKTYGRLSGNWTPVLPIIGGALTGNLSVAGTTTLSSTLTVNATANASNLAVGSPTVPGDALAGTLRMGSNVISNEFSPSPIIQLASNAYETNVAGGWKYLTTGTASVVSNRADGTWGWYNAVSGTAGAVVSWVQRMGLTANGDLSTTGAATFAGGGTYNGGTVSVNASGVAAYATLGLNCSSGAAASQLSGLRTGTQRWLLQMPNATPDGAANAGSDFALYAYDNTGAYLNSPLAIIRASGQVNVNYRLNVSGDSSCAAASYSTGGFYAGAYGDSSFGMFRNSTYRYFQFAGNYYMRGDVSSGNVDWIQNGNVRATLTGAGAFACSTSLSAGTTVSASSTIYGYGGRIISQAYSNNVGFCCFDTVGYASGMFLWAGSGGVLYLGRMDGSGNYVGPWYANFTDTQTTTNGNFTSNGNISTNQTCYFGGAVSLQTNNYGIQYNSGYGATHNTIVFGWSNAVNGLVSVGVDNGGAFYAVANGSDERLKLNIADSTHDALDTVNQLQTREFDWMEFTASDPRKLREARAEAKVSEQMSHVRMGLIAQEVNKIYPEGVWQGDDFEDKLGQVWGLDQNVMIALLVGAVQQLTARVNTLENA